MATRASAIAAESERIRNKVVAFEVDDEIRVALERVATSNNALRILGDMDLTDSQHSRLVSSFIGAVQIKGEFSAILREGAETLKETPGLLKSVSDLQGFLQKLSAQMPGGIRATISFVSEENLRLRRALAEIEKLIELHERTARETPGRIGATRKSKGKVARENAAMGWLAAGIKHITKRPWLRETCVLAETLLEIPEISEERLRRALRNRDKEWRLP